MSDTHRRRVGGRFQPDRLDAELSARGLTGADLVRLAGLNKNTITRARQGQRITSQSMDRIAAALSKAPKRPGLGQLVEHRS